MTLMILMWWTKTWIVLRLGETGLASKPDSPSRGMHCRAALQPQMASGLASDSRCGYETICREAGQMKACVLEAEDPTRR
ncbi:hypothetical protein ID866_11222 [Astraeus odoratus]|nr:hypothetical protein ID866_11222 [Astraeus odoratus]